MFMFKFNDNAVVIRYINISGFKLLLETNLTCDRVVCMNIIFLTRYNCKRLIIIRKTNSAVAKPDISQVSRFCSLSVDVGNLVSTAAN